MNPRLVAIDGPLQGTVLALTEGETSIGRESSNRICIRDLSVSRRHSLIQREGERFTLRDLDSFNGTLVNGVPVKERVLEPGDRIKIGRALFLFLVGDQEADPAPDPVRLDESALVLGATVQLRREDARYLQPEK